MQVLSADICIAQTSTQQIFYKGLDYASNGQFIKAKEQFDEALRLDPSFEPAEGAKNILDRALGKKIKSPAIILYFKTTRKALKNEFASFAEIIDEYSKVIKLDSNFADAYNVRSEFFSREGQYGRAIADLNKAIALEPDSWDFYYTRGIAYTKTGQYEKAINDLTKFIERAPGYAQAYFERGVSYIKTRQYHRAVTDFTKAIELNPKNVSSYNNRGYIYMEKLGKKREACSDWEYACDLGDCTNYKTAIRNGDCK